MNCMNCGGAVGAGLRFCPACGTPAPSAPPPGEVRASWQPAPPAAPAPRKSRAGKILLVVFGVFLVLAVGAAVAVYFGVRYFADTIKASEPYQIAERELRENPKAAGVLGRVKSTGFPVGAYGTEADGSGHAAFTMSVEGELASAQYVVMLERKGGAWRIVNGDLRMSDGRVVNLVGGEEGSDKGGDTGEQFVLGNEPPPPPGTEPVRVPGAVDAGALDDKALSRPEPPYPPAARTVGAAGKVVVNVTVDESGRVIMAAAASGHPLLRAAAVAAARQARFSPTLKDGRPAKAVGTLTYKFE